MAFLISEKCTDGSERTMGRTKRIVVEREGDELFRRTATSVAPESGVAKAFIVKRGDPLTVGRKMECQYTVLGDDIFPDEVCYDIIAD